MNTPTIETEHDIKALIKQCEQAFVDLIRQKLGIIIHDHQIRELHKTIHEACDKFNCLPQKYLLMLSDCANDSPLLEHLVAGITVGETYFFRDKNQMNLLKNVILPGIIETKRKEKNLSLRIWSAGCSSGEEIYTIAILLDEILPDLSLWTLNLLGTDINTESLHKAIAARYSEWSMRSITDYYKHKYFTQHDRHYMLLPRFRDHVKFDFLNLNDNTYPSMLNATNAQDLILCRNVLIYFDNSHIASLMKRLSDSLIPGGYLILGASDPIDIKSTDLQFHHEHGILFSKPTMEEKITSTQKVSVKQEVKHSKKIKRDIPKLGSPVAPVQSSSKKTIQKMDDSIITKLLYDSQWQEILNILNDYQLPMSAFQLTAQATAMANLGRLEEAIATFDKSLALDPTKANTYLVYALTLVELNKLELAEAALRKSIFLDHQFVVGHYQLGLLLIRNKKHDAGLKCLHNALAIAKGVVPEKNVLESTNLSYGRLVEILTYEIELYSKMGNYHAPSGSTREEI